MRGRSLYKRFRLPLALSLVLVVCAVSLGYRVSLVQAPTIHLAISSPADKQLFARASITSAVATVTTSPKANPSTMTIAQKSLANPLINPRPARLGLFVSDSPSDVAKATRTLDWAAAAGFDTLYNYASFDGTPEQLDAYLAAAGARHLQIIFSLKDLYDALPAGADTAKTFSSWGSSNAEIARNIVAHVAGNPATYGFGITDERPESLADLATWQPILKTRYQEIKSLTSKPVIALLVGWTSGSSVDRRQLLAGLSGATDHFALDYYPIPFDSLANINLIARDLVAAGDSDGWFIEQAFSWASYPETTLGLGHNPAAARFPTADEIVSMGRGALASGAKNIMVYSYFDISSSPSQLSALKTAAARLRSGN